MRILFLALCVLAFSACVDPIGPVCRVVTDTIYTGHSLGVDTTIVTIETCVDRVRIP